MLRLVDAQVIEDEAEAIAASLRRHERVALRWDAAMDQDQIVAATVRTLGSDAVVATVPASLDQVTRTILELASSLGRADVSNIDDALRDQGPHASKEVLLRLDKALAGRPVIVERVENLDPPERDEVAAALREPREDLTRWILERADLVTVPRGASNFDERWPGALRSLLLPPTPPVQLQNGAVQPSSVRWEECADVRTLELSLALEALGVVPGEDADLVGGLNAGSLRERLRDALPEGVLTLLKALAIHGRPMPLEVLSRIPEYEREAFDLGLSLALWRSRAGCAVVDPAWTDWGLRTLARSELHDIRRALAETFVCEVSPDDSSSRLAGLSMLEAHRHLLAVGDVERALQYARYGVEMVVGVARDLSKDRQFARSAALYERVLSKPALMSLHLRGYARHYLHYNRAHERPELEPVAETARGYEASLRDWPENAIFWSRAVRSWYLAGDAVQARECLQRARRQVPAHRDKDTRLVARTARRLVERGLLLDAIDVWGDYVPDTLRAAEDAKRLRASLEEGWDASRLEVPGVPPLVLLRRERFKILQQQDGWRFVAEHLGRSARCATPIESARAFVQKVSDEVRSLLRALDRDLDDEQRERKRTLVSMVDVIASRLDAPASATTWVYGKLERDEHGALWLVAVDNLAARYEIPAELTGSLVVGEGAWLAEVEAGLSGVPRGPVRALDKLPRSDPDTVRRRWRERLSS